MRFCHKFTRLISTKTDLDAAYRRIHATVSAVVACITKIGDLAYLLLRLPFGAKLAGTRFTTVSDSTVDLTNAITNDESWDADEVHSHHYKMINTLPLHLQDNNIPFG